MGEVPLYNRNPKPETRYADLNISFLDPNAALRGCVTYKTLTFKARIQSGPSEYSLSVTSRVFAMRPGEPQYLSLIVQPEPPAGNTAGFPLAVNPTVQVCTPTLFRCVPSNPSLESCTRKP